MLLAGAGRAGAGSRGFSLVELAVAIAVISVLLYFLLDRVLYMQEVAEKTEVEETIRSINYGLRLEAASRMARGTEPKQLALEMENPVKWLSTSPRNYLGEFSKAPMGVQPGHWYFHTPEGQLVYRPNRAAHLLVEKGKLKELRFAVRVEASEPQPRLVPLSSHKWFGEIVGQKRQ